MIYTRFKVLGIDLGQCSMRIYYKCKYFSNIILCCWLDIQAKLVLVVHIIILTNNLFNLFEKKFYPVQDFWQIQNAEISVYPSYCLWRYQLVVWELNQSFLFVHRCYLYCINSTTTANSSKWWQLNTNNI